MPPQPELVETIGPHERLRQDLAKVESETRAIRVFLIFVAVALVLGAISLFLPRGVWAQGSLEMRIPPQLIFVAMVTGVVVALYLIRYESESRKLRLLALEQALAARSEHAANMVDSLTQVYNRTVLRELLQKEIARSERASRPLSLMMCDLDNFKRVNDIYGHLRGDDILAQVAGVLKSCVRGSDHVVRYGGDEFLLILPETDDPGARIVRDRILVQIGDLDQANHIGPINLSLCLGILQHVPGRTVEQDVAEVDARMYNQKRGAPVRQPAVERTTGQT
ncbi:MAG TPA: GGDEF domain-containing protein [Terriglobia bacterium]|nr:GGDEF domain-containing protein [Terriglobia bacterium]